MNVERERALKQFKVELLHRGQGISTSQELMRSADLALAANTFSLSEFIQALLYCAREAAGGASRAPPRDGRRDDAHPVQDLGPLDMVTTFMEESLIPLARRTGCEGFREALQSTPILYEAASSHQSKLDGILARYGGGVSSSNGPSAQLQSTLGVPLHRFIDMCEFVSPLLPRTAIKAAFLQSCPLSALADPATGTARTLDAQKLFQAVVRIALALRDLDLSTTGGAPSPRGTVTNSKATNCLVDLDTLGLRRLQRNIGTILSRAARVDADAEVAMPAAAKILQALARGRAARARIQRDQRNVGVFSWKPPWQ